MLYVSGSNLTPSLKITLLYPKAAVRLLVSQANLRARIYRRIKAGSTKNTLESILLGN